MSIGIFPNDPNNPYEPSKKNQPQKAPFPSIDEPTPNRSEDQDEDLGFDEGILNAKK